MGDLRHGRLRRFGLAAAVAVGLLAGPLVAGAPASADPEPEPDVTAPAIWCDTPTGGPIFADEVVIHCAATDAGGLADEADASFTLTTDVGEDNEAEAAPVPGRTVCDLAGNCASSGDFGPFTVDRKAPVVTISSPAANAMIPVGASVAPIYSCTDLTRLTCVASPMPMTPGLQWVWVTSTDRAGHETVVGRQYQVVGGTLAGTVLSSSSYLGGVQVDVWGPYSPLTGPPTATATTSPNGAWRIDGMMPGAPYRVRYTKTGYVEQWHENATSAATANPMYADPDNDQYTPNYLALLKPSDSSGPTVTCAVPTNQTWQSSQVFFNCTASDPSGLSSGSPATFTLGTSVPSGTETANATTNSVMVCDTLGNCTTAVYSGFKIDRKAPTANCTTPSTGWSRDNFAVPCTVVDAGIGSMATNFTLTTNVAAGAWSATASTNTFLMCDRLSNCAPSQQFTNLKVDRAPPTVSCQPAPTAWLGNNASVPCNPADAGSGYTGATTVTAVTNVSLGQENANATANALVCDAAGNCIVNLQTGFKIDRRPPTVTCANPDGLWHNANVSLNCTIADSGAGLPATYELFPGSIFFTFPYPTSFSATTSVAEGAESANAVAIPSSVPPKCDIVNNCTSVSVSGNKVDRKAPVVTCPTPSTQWFGTNSVGSCTAADGGSGVVSSTVPISTGLQAGEESAAASTVQTTSCDRMANCATVAPTGPWKVDRKGPSVVCDAPDPGVVSDDEVSVSCTASDAGSGLASSGDSEFSLSTALGAGEEGPVSTGTKTVCDAIGSCTTAGPLGPFDVDRKAPSVAITSPAPGAVLRQGTPVEADFACDDRYLAVCEGSTPDGEALPDSLGDHELTVTGTDEVGNTTTVTRSYTVVEADTTPPTIECSAPAPSTTWGSTQVTGTCTATDPSGLADPDQASFAITTAVADGDETATATMEPVEVCDALGNCASSEGYGPYQIDRKAPAVTCASPDDLWHEADVALGCSIADGGAGLPETYEPTPGETLPYPSTFEARTSVAAGSESASAVATPDASLPLCDVLDNCTTVAIDGNKVDRKAPEVTITSPTASQVLIQGTPVAADFACDDTHLATCVGSTADGDPLPDSPGSHDLTVTGTDLAGNTTSVTRTYMVLVPDATPPTITCSAPNPTSTWRTTQVAGSCTATDSSGLADPGQASFAITTAVADGEETATATMTPVSVCDTRGNCATTSGYGPYKIDRKVPSAPCTGTIPTGWTKSEVTVSCTSSDAGSGLATSASFSLTTSVGAGNWNAAASTSAKNVCDKAGNCRTVRYDDLKVDRAGPAMDCTPAPTGWVNANISITCTPSDGGSGYAGAATVKSSTTLSPKFESDALSLTLRACDQIGNCTNQVFSGLKVDRKAPVVTCGTPDGLWHAANVSLDCTQVDGGSGLTPTSPGGGGPFAAVTAIGAGSESANAPAKATSSCDQVGNCTAISISGNKVDRRAPSRTCPPSDGVWHAENVTVTCSASDAGSGLAADSPASFPASTTVAPGSALSGAPLGSVTTCDAVGNCATGAPTGSWKVDRKAPTVTVTVPKSNGVLLIGVPVTVTFACTDANSGLASCTGTQASGTTLVPTTLGPATFEVVGVDAVGNRTTTTVSYRVAAPVGGTVRDASTGLGAEGVIVSRYPATGEGPAIDSAISGADGSFAFPDAEPGSYRFGAEKPGAYGPKWFGGSTFATARVYVVDGITPTTLATLSLTPIL